MLEATSYGLMALGMILVAAFCFVCVEEKAALQANRSPSLVDESKMNSLRIAGTAAPNRSRTESAGEEELTGLVLSLQMTSPTQAHPGGPDGISPPREQGSEDAFHG
jgi:hypothetical protein